MGKKLKLSQMAWTSEVCPLRKDPHSFPACINEALMIKGMWPLQLPFFMAFPSYWIWKIIGWKSCCLKCSGMGPEFSGGAHTLHTRCNSWHFHVGLGKIIVWNPWELLPIRVEPDGPKVRLGTKLFHMFSTGYQSRRWDQWIPLDTFVQLSVYGNSCIIKTCPKMM